MKGADQRLVNPADPPVFRLSTVGMLLLPLVILIPVGVVLSLRFFQQGKAVLIVAFLVAVIVPAVVTIVSYREHPTRLRRLQCIFFFVFGVWVYVLPVLVGSAAWWAMHLYVPSP